jgi:hypothetical protein
VAALTGYEYACQRSPVRGVLRAAAKLLREADEAAANAAHMKLVERCVRDWRAELNEVRRRRREQFEIVRRFACSAMDVFVNPRGALRQVYRHHATRGLAATIAALRSDPDQFGPLTTFTAELRIGWTGWPLLRLTTYKRARADAGMLAGDLREALFAFEDRPSLAEVQRMIQGLRGMQSELEMLSDMGYQHMAGKADSLVMEAALLLEPLHGGKDSSRTRLARQLTPMLPPTASVYVYEALKITRQAMTV